MTSDILSQEEIDALLQGDSEDLDDEYLEDEDMSEILSDMEKDALGEIGNISMGTAATTLSTLLNRKVNITTPTVSITSADELADQHKVPFIIVDVSYKEGLEGSNFMILHTDDAKVITDLMMGKTEVDKEREISELDLSAVGEAMNQMMGSAATSLSEMFMKRIDINPPNSMVIDFADGKNEIDLLKGSTPIIKTSFRMVIEGFIDSTIMQLTPIEFGKEMVYNLMNTINQGGEDELQEEVITSPEPEVTSISQERHVPQMEAENLAKSEALDYNNESKAEVEKVIVTKPEFQSFDSREKTGTFNEGIDLVGDIPIEITVELGRTHRTISDILEFGLGTVIELEKSVGESLNIYANGKYIAKGEVVVIEDNFGIRVKEIDNNYKKIL